MPDLVKDPSTLADKEFDYVIVGAGAAGCVLAHRLSENGVYHVLLLEAGGNHENELFSKIPAAFPNLFKTKADWNYSTTRQKELNERELYWPRGKMLGGSTSINAMMYQHSTPQDLNEWESKGCTGWGYEAMRPYFRKSEKHTPRAAHAEHPNEHRGDSGYWHTGYSHSFETTDAFIETCEKVGIKRSNDINTPAGALGVNHFISFIDAKGRRSSTATAYLSNKVLDRPNLTVAINTMTTKVVFEPRATGIPVATGVIVAGSKKGPRFQIKARKEVIMSAGSIGTPQILMASGVGPAEVLKEAKVPLILENKHLGDHMYDHLAAPCIFRARHSLEYLGHPILSIPALVRWLYDGKSPMCSNVGEAAAFIRLDETTELAKSSVSKLSDKVVDNTSGPGSPDIEIISAPAAYFAHGLIKPPAGTMGCTIAPVHIRPLSYGNVKIKSADVFEDPILEANYFSNPADIENLTRAMRIAMRIGRSQPMAEHLILDHKNNDIDDMYWLGDADPETITDDEIQKWLRNRVETLYHPVGTARMGASQKDAVVDPKLKVFGIDGLRIVDASIFPAQISGHPTATVIAIGEKASEIILSEA